MKKRKFTVLFRIMHWTMAVSVCLILVTVFLRIYWMNKDHIAGILNSGLTELNITLTKEQLTKIAKQIRKPMWNWHVYIGYVLTGLFIVRLMLPVVGQMKFSNPFSKISTGKEKIQSWIYLIYYTGLGITLITGIIIENGPRSMKNSMESIHVLSLYFMILFLILHLGGIILGEHTTKKGIVSKIIGGGINL